jgi:hypothetical protein
MHFIKRFWFQGVRRLRDEYEETQEELERGSPVLRISIIVLSLYVLGSLCLGVYWSFTPDVLPSPANSYQVVSDNPPPPFIVGLATTSTLITVTETLWNKPGGYLANDMLPPGVWLDNMPHWELGVILQVRDMVHMLRVSFSQSSENRLVDDDLQKAEVRLNFDSHSWLFPAAESPYAAGVEHLEKYASRLSKGENADAYFFADAQHLNDYLAGVEFRLKNLAQRLTASVGATIDGDIAVNAVNDSSVNGLYKKTDWLKTDDVFYEARGSAWALIALLRAVEVDFFGVLNEKNAFANYEQILRELEATQQPLYSPIILNGEGFGFVANHSLIMASYISRTQFAIADCRRLLLKPTLP